MKFVDNLSEEEYVSFETNHKKAHFMQSYEWGQFAIKGKKQMPLYVGIKDEHNNILCAALLLLKKIKFGYSYAYCPRGYVIDFNDFSLLEKFTTLLKDYMKQNKIIYLKIDPDIMYREIDENACEIENGKNNKDIFNNLVKLGYLHKGFNKLYEGNQPRYTFRIDLTKSKEQIDAKINKSFMKSVKRSYSYLLEIDSKPDIKRFCELNKSNSQKDGFTAYSYDYFKEFYEQFKKYNNVKFFNAYLPVKKILTQINENIEQVNNKSKEDKKHQVDLQNQLNRLNKDKEVFSKIDEDRVMVCSLICVYQGKYAWSLYIGSDELANYTFAVSRCYYDSIIDAKNNGYVFYDLFGTVGDPKTNYKNLAHLHDFKRKFGDEYIEFVGEFDLVNNKFLYKLLPIMLSIYRKLRKLL